MEIIGVHEYKCDCLVNISVNNSGDGHCECATVMMPGEESAGAGITLNNTTVYVNARENE